MNLKTILKSLKENESTVSMVLGAGVVIVVGVLVVNYFRNLPTNFQGELAGGNSSEGQEQASMQNNQETHIVVAGESLWTISENYYGTGYDWTKIAEANDMNTPGMLEEGQELVIPQTEDVSETAMAEETQESMMQEDESQEEVAGAMDENNAQAMEHEINAQAGSVYEVQRGDSLWNISVAVYGDGYHWTQIAELNNLANPSLIHTGNQLVLPE